MIGIKVKVKNVEYNQNLLRRFRTNIGLLGKPLGKVADVMRKDGFLRQFSTEGRYGTGSRWKALKPGTINSRLKMGWGAGPILVRTGDLMRSWASKAHRGHAQKVGRTSVTLGSILTVGRGTHYLGAIHHYGTKRHGRLACPSRPIMGYDGEIPLDLRNKMNAVIVKFINIFTKALQ